LAEIVTLQTSEHKPAV